MSRALMMASGSGDDGSVFPYSAQDVSNLVIDGDRIRKKWSMAAILNRVGLAAPFRVGAARLESCLIL